MLGMGARASHGLRLGVCGLAAVVAILTIATDPADARARRKRVYHQPRPAPVAVYNPLSAEIVVDANTGAVMHASNADATRHPASLTKIMTLYLLFERLEAGKIRLTTQMPVSDHASIQAPTKLGLRPGQTLMVEDAIQALVTKSANDAAAVVAEALAGDEDDFAKMMTRKARALGMSKTVYKNASGLPDPEQITTARDQATLGRAIQERFPKYYTYFSTYRFTYRGRTMRNHNMLLGNVEGVDGIKTGYTRASGFNLVTSMKRGGRHLVAVVLGGRSGGARDARMRDLISSNIMVASARRTAPMIAEVVEKQTPPGQPLRIAAASPTPVPTPTPAPAATRQDTTTTAAIPVPRPSPGSTDPMRPTPVKTLSVRPAAVQTASLVPLLSAFAPTHEPPAAPTPIVQARELPAPPPPVAKVDAVAAVIATTAPAAQLPAAKKIAAAPAPAPAPVLRTGWIIQVGAFTDESEAKERLSSAKATAARMLSSADPFTEAYQKGDTTYYRARFAGLDKNKAEAACKYLKRNDVACFAVKN